ncbi:hypothetical protein SK128_020081 [Halocaridina rubra]|uniref:C2H2-type domain-containing protein n=1 Tax=Halocaridina rubra TaxID=373956 RepID=A0AAN9A1A7_HALRR
MSKEGIIVSSLSSATGETLDMLEEGMEHASVVVVAEGGGAVTFELSDGTQALVQNTLKEEQPEMEGVAIQLEDGRIGYIYGDTLLQAVTDEPVSGAACIKAEVEDPLYVQNAGDQLYVQNTNGKLACNFPNCGKVYSTISHLKIHQRSHTGDRPHECVVCKRSFTTGYALKSHMRIHTGEKPYACPEVKCGKCFKTSGDMQKHVRTHTGERPFKCEVCEKSFTTSNIRKVHMRVHTGEKPYECQYEGCNRKFASATNFRNHYRIHTGEKPYVCSVGNCGKRFTEYSSLYKHHVVHNQQKRYCCIHCGRFYRQLSTLAVHRKTVHNIVENEDALIWMGQDMQVGLLSEEKGETPDDDPMVFQAHNTSSGTKTVRIATDIELPKKDNQIIPGTIISSHFLENGVEVSNIDLSGEALIQDERGTTLTSLELDDGGNGSILVLTDASQLAALQQLAVAGGSGESSEDGVKVISLDDFTTVAESTVSEGVKDDVKREDIINCDTKNIILIREVNQKVN